MSKGKNCPAPSAGHGPSECWTTVRSVVDVWVLAANCAPAPAPAPAPPPPPPPRIWHRPKCA